MPVAVTAWRDRILDANEMANIRQLGDDVLYDLDKRRHH